MEAIERIAGYACEVNEDQWRELVIMRNGDCKVISRNIGSGIYGYAHFCDDEKTIVLSGLLKMVTPPQVIPYPDFLAKLKGEEKWEPKNGEEVEVRIDRGKNWFKARFIGMDGDLFVCYESGPYHIGVKESSIRQLRPTITRAEAEQVLGKRIVD